MTVALAGNAVLIQIIAGLAARLAAVRMLIAQQANAFAMLAGLLATAVKLMRTGASVILAEAMFAGAAVVARLVLAWLIGAVAMMMAVGE